MCLIFDANIAFILSNQVPLAINLVPPVQLIDKQMFASVNIVKLMEIKMAVQITHRHLILEFVQITV